MIDPITVATITSAVTLLATEAGKGVAGEVGKDLWTQVKGVLRLNKDLPQAQLAPVIAQRLLEDGGAAGEVVRLLQQNVSYPGDAPAIVRNINAEKVVLITEQTVAGDFNLNL